MRTILCAIVFTLATSAAHAAEKVALLIGNSAYTRHAAPPLNNPVNDVRALARALSAHGFDVTPLQNQTLAQMQSALRDFRQKADRAETAMVFYAGHGIEIGGTNDLIPTDAQLDDERDAPVEAVSMDTVLRQISGASRLKMVVLDACRNNPFIARMLRRGATRSGGAGLAEAKARTGDTLIAYAAAPGETTPDGPPGGNSPYTRALIDALGGESLDVRRLFGTARDILRKTVPHAEPFLETSLGGAEYLIQGRGQSESALAEPQDKTLTSLPSPLPRPTTISKQAEAGRLYDEGYKYFYGEGTEEDKKRGVRVLRQAAEMGSTRAMYVLGIAYGNGSGVAKSPATSIEWYSRAADLGQADAIGMLGHLYDRGKGVPENNDLANRSYRTHGIY